ncbi:MAG TPA: MYXO-CTERM sorting domain-containing protein [Myxococcota bacterium]|nr:MYXO-CTERM sorting domain-containing protein [Myxococcota bacterium]
MLIFGLIACGGPVAFQDDIDDRLDIFGPRNDDLSTPYVETAAFEMSIVPRRDKDITGWTLSSSDPTVLELGELEADDSGLSAQAHALSTGEVELQAFDETGKLRATELVEVRRPTRLEVEHVAPLLLGDPDVLGEEVPQLLVGGSATMLVEYFDEDGQLHGQAEGLTLDAHPMLNPTTLQRDYEENVDFIQISPELAGDFSFTVSMGDVEREIEVVGVTIDALDHLAIARTDEEEDGGNQVVVVLGEDSTDRPILGVEPGWRINGQLREETGDVWVYQLEKGVESQAIASFDRHQVGFDFQSSDGAVHSTNTPGCSATGLGASALLAMAGLVVIRRRST